MYTCQFSKKKFFMKKLHCRCLTRFQIRLSLWQVLVGKVNGWKKNQKVINFNSETSRKSFVILFRGVFRTQSNIYDRAFLGKELTIKSYWLFSKKSSIADVRQGSKYASSVNHRMAYFIKRTFRKSIPLEKQTLCQNLLYWSKSPSRQIRGSWFQIWQYFSLKLLPKDF